MSKLLINASCFINKDNTESEVATLADLDSMKIDIQNNYLSKNGGGGLNRNAQISREGSDISWYLGRNYALLKTSTYGGAGNAAYSPLISLKSETGSWEMGTYTNDTLWFTHISDSNFNANTNAITAQIGFNKDGTISGNLSGTANNANALSGMVATASNVANTIVARDANGYIYGTYYNQSSGAESMTTSSYFLYCNSDGWHRKGTIASARSALGMADFIVEQSANRNPMNGWVYRKWNSGVAECWINPSYSSIPVTTAWGNIYDSDSLKCQLPSYPFQFAAVPTVNVSILYTSSGWGVVERGGTSANTVTPGNVSIVRGTVSTLGGVRMAVHAIGMWK